MEPSAANGSGAEMFSYGKFIALPGRGEPGSVRLPSRGKGEIFTVRVVDHRVLLTTAGCLVRVPDLGHRTAALAL